MSDTYQPIEKPVLEVPNKKTMLQQDYFIDQSRIIAPDLLGRIIVRETDDETLLGKIREVSAWHGVTPKAAETIKYAPGMIGISRKFGYNIMDIATDSHKKASCVTIVAVETPDGELIQGPGKVTAYLNIDEKLDSAPIYHPLLWIGGDAVSSCDINRRQKKKVPSNCRGYFYTK